MSKKDGIIYFPIKQRWLDMISVGFKREEYREITDYWKKRFLTSGGTFIDYHTAIFHMYGKVEPVKADIIDIRIGTGKPEWGAVPYKEYFVTEIDDAHFDLPF